MNARQAKRAVMVSILGSAGFVIFDKAQSGEWPEPRIFIGLAIVYVVLGFTADLAPTIAGPFSILFLLGVIVTKGSLVADGFERIVSNRQAKKNRGKMHSVKGGKAS